MSSRASEAKNLGANLSLSVILSVAKDLKAPPSRSVILSEAKDLEATLSRSVILSEAKDLKAEWRNAKHMSRHSEPPQGGVEPASAASPNQCHSERAKRAEESSAGSTEQGTEKQGSPKQGEYCSLQTPAPVRRGDKLYKYE